MTEKALHIENLSIRYPNPKGFFEAVKDVSIDIEGGQFLALLGPNGAGKTSLITSIVGLTDFQGGNISVFGSKAGSKNAKREIGYVPQELVGYGFFTVNEILNFVSGYFGIKNNQKRIDELLERLHLTQEKHKLVSRLSGGMKRRFLIAKALVHKPRLLLLDEPSAGVDVELRETLWIFVRELHHQGTAILLTTHYIEEAEQLSESTAVIDHGRLIAWDKTKDLVSKMSLKKIRLEFFEKSPLWENLKNRQDLGVFDLQLKDKALEFSVRPNLSFQDLLKIYSLPIEGLADIHMEEGSLESAFKRLIARN